MTGDSTKCPNGRQNISRIKSTTYNGGLVAPVTFLGRLKNIFMCTNKEQATARREFFDKTALEE
jgi:hypothetical protein